MRIFWVLLVLAVAAVARAECVPKGTPIFRVSSGPVHGAPAGEPPDWTVEIFANGAWTRHTERATVGGCVPMDVLGRLEQWIAQAKFQFVPGMSCHIAPKRIVIYDAPKRSKRVMLLAPCGKPLDHATARAGSCAAAVATTAEAIASECAPDRE